jgi:hypothetical protein
MFRSLATCFEDGQGWWDESVGAAIDPLKHIIVGRAAASASGYRRPSASAFVVTSSTAQQPVSELPSKGAQIFRDPARQENAAASVPQTHHWNQDL